MVNGVVGSDGNSTFVLENRMDSFSQKNFCVVYGSPIVLLSLCVTLKVC